MHRRALALMSLVALGACQSAWSQPRGRARPADASAPGCRFPLVAIDPEEHCGRPGQRWAGSAAAGAIASCQPGEARRPDGSGCDPRGDDGPAVDAGLTAPRAPVTAAQRAAAGPTRALVAGATWRLGGRWVAVGTFALDRTEVTVGAWRRCVAAGMCAALSDPLATMTRDAMPVVNVTHAQAERFCTWAGARLPTDAEWSLGALGVEGRSAPWGTRAASCALARSSGCGDGPAAVGSIPAGASPEGALDLVGNVAEWVHDRAGASAPTAGVDRDPTGPTRGSTRRLRGGSFRTPDDEADGRWRGAADEREARVDVGFRCARGL